MLDWPSSRYLTAERAVRVHVKSRREEPFGNEITGHLQKGHLLSPNGCNLPSSHSITPTNML